jgi:pyruvate dehydrogenase E2 component (dihydrolipoamide acetyltransferase)
VSKQVEVRVPDIGDFENVEIVDVVVEVGATVAVEDPLITLETDKASMDVPSTVGGTIARLAVQAGDRVSQGDLVAVIDVADTAREADRPESSETAAPAATDTPPEPAPAGPAAPLEVRVPDIGDFADVDVIEVHVVPGDVVEFDDPLITLETDKASMDVPSTAAGKVREVAVEPGSKVSQGDLVLTLEAAMAAGDEKPAPTAAAAAPAPDKAPPAEAPVAAPAAPPARGMPPIDEASFATAHAGPSVRKFARELGVDLARVQGSGRKGRITADDVKSFVKQAIAGVDATGRPAGPGLPEVPEVDFTRFGAIEIEPLTRVQKISGPRLHASWVNLPHVTQFDEADITALEERRQKLKDKAAKQGARLTPLAFLIVACVHALREFPRFNSSLDPAGENLVMKKYFHIGFAADTPNGLVVPVVKDADKKTLLEIARDLADLSARARDGKLGPTEMLGGCFTISSLGSIGGTAFTPIINAPEVAILGVSRSRMQPLWNGEGFEPRLTLPMSLSYDHRVIDGAEAVRFTRFLADQLADPDGLMLS